MTTGDIANHLADVYGSQVSRDLVSRVTDAVVADMTEWANRPLDPVYPVLLIDCIFIRVRDGQVANRPVYVAMAIGLDGERDVLGMWLGPTGGEGAKVWLGMLTELKNRGVQDVLIACCDGLKGLPDAITATWPQATVLQEGLERGHRRPQARLHRPDHRRGRGPVHRVRRGLARPVPGDGRDVAAVLDRVRPVPRLPRRDPQADLHDEPDRVPERPVPGRGPPPRTLPDL
jgi:hypothetical protein